MMNGIQIPQPTRPPGDLDTATASALAAEAVAKITDLLARVPQAGIVADFNLEGRFWTAVLMWPRHGGLMTGVGRTYAEAVVELAHIHFGDRTMTNWDGMIAEWEQRAALEGGA